MDGVKTGRSLDEKLELLRSDPDLRVLLNNLYVQAKTCATSPFAKERGRKEFVEIAELDMITYLQNSEQVKWKGQS
jgi:hypothetical protein